MTEQELERIVTTPLYLQKGITDEEMNAFYTVGYNYYRAGAYDKAESVFAGLVVLDRMSEKYQMALAGAYQAQKKWQKAIDVYQLVVAGINVRNTTASERAAQCFEALGDKEKAAMAREHAKFFNANRKEASK